jgi:ubiquinone/menaquinone biosynthesis C-methylase UbiE
MREVAQAQARHPGVRYLAGSAEDMPVPSGSADYALMFLSWHHVQDKPRAAWELVTVNIRFAIILRFLKIEPVH